MAGVVPTGTAVPVKNYMPEAGSGQRAGAAGVASGGNCGKAIPSAYYRFIVDNLPDEVRSWPIEQQSEFICFFAGMVQKESGWNPAAYNDGARGLCQMKPETESSIRRDYRLNTAGMTRAQQDLYCGMHYLVKMLHMAEAYTRNPKEQWTIVLSYYTMGEQGGQRVIDRYVPREFDCPTGSGESTQFLDYFTGARPSVNAHCRQVFENMESYLCGSCPALIDDLARAQEDWLLTPPR